MSYVKSLRFKLMLLCIIPLLSAAFLFIAHSVIIAYQMRDITKEAVLMAMVNAEVSDAVLTSVKDTMPNMGWIGKQWTIVFCVLFVCFYIPITINIAKFIKPIRILAKHSNKLAEGDVNIEVVKDRTDEIGILQESFKELVATSRNQAELIQNIADGDISGSYTPRSEADIVGHSIVKMLLGNNHLIAQLNESINEMVIAATQISDGSQALASGGAVQSTAADSISLSMEDVAKIPGDNMKMAKIAGNIAQKVLKNAENGNRMMEQMLSAVNEILNANTQVQRVVKEIDDIAFQTNILALNAAVEAARAGQHGKGFAVVAEEVRNLATKSAESAKNTDQLINDAMKKADIGVSIANQTAESFTGIVSGIRENSKIVLDISNSSKNQDVSISSIRENINQLSQVIVQNSAAAEEYAASSESMKENANTLKMLISHFKLSMFTRTQLQLREALTETSNT